MEECRRCGGRGEIKMFKHYCPHCDIEFDAEAAHPKLCPMSAYMDDISEVRGPAEPVRCPNCHKKTFGSWTFIRVH